jgi:hypothetical protein
MNNYKYASAMRIKALKDLAPFRDKVVTQFSFAKDMSHMEVNCEDKSFFRVSACDGMLNVKVLNEAESEKKAQEKARQEIMSRDTWELEDDYECIREQLIIYAKGRNVSISPKLNKDSRLYRLVLENITNKYGKYYVALIDKMDNPINCVKVVSCSVVVAVLEWAKHNGYYNKFLDMDAMTYKGLLIYVGRIPYVKPREEESIVDSAKTLQNVSELMEMHILGLVEGGAKYKTFYVTWESGGHDDYQWRYELRTELEARSETEAVYLWAMHNNKVDSHLDLFEKTYMGWRLIIDTQDCIFVNGKKYVLEEQDWEGMGK